MEPEWFLKSEEKEVQLKTDEEQTVQVDASAEAMPTTAREDTVFQRLELIKKYFPYSLTPSHIIANMCWEYVSTWAKKPDNNVLLKTGLHCLELIPDQSLKLGEPFLFLGECLDWLTSATFGHSLSTLSWLQCGQAEESSCF